jgi:hypothetical protein
MPYFYNQHILNQLKKLKKTYFLFLLLGAVSAFAQRDSTKLSPKFRFSDGIYTAFADLKANKPTYPLKNLRGTLTLNTKEYLAKVLPKPNSIADSTTVAANTAYCLVIDGVPYIRWATDTAQRSATTTFLGLQIVGKIAYFAYSKEEDKAIKMPVYDPMSGRKMYTGTIHNREKTNIRKLLNFATGEIADFTLNNLKKWVADDKKLLLTMADITPNEAQQRLFKCLLIYNDRNNVFVKK